MTTGVFSLWLDLLPELRGEVRHWLDAPTRCALARTSTAMHQETEVPILPMPWRRAFFSRDDTPPEVRRNAAARCLELLALGLPAWPRHRLCRCRDSVQYGSNGDVVIWYWCWDNKDGRYLFACGHRTHGWNVSWSIPSTMAGVRHFLGATLANLEGETLRAWRGIVEGWDVHSE